MKFLRLSRLALLACLYPAAAFASLEKDLGQSLAFYRVTQPGADRVSMMEAIHRSAALVLDLRGVEAEPEFISSLHAALAKPVPENAVRMVLVDQDTAPAIMAALDDDSLLSVITLAPRMTRYSADITLATTASEQKTAMDALAQGIPVEKLTADIREKRRFDEAKLVHDHANGVSPDDAFPADAEDDSLSEPAPEKGKNKGEGKPAEETPAPRDLVLERAIHLHRTLVALKKI